MPLRRRLTLWMAVLLVVGLALADVVTYTSLRSFLYGRLDDQLATSQGVVARAFTRAAHPRDGHPLTLATKRTQTRLERFVEVDITPEVAVTFLGQGGKVLLTIPAGPVAPPVVPRSVRLAPQTHSGRGAYRQDPNDVNLMSKAVDGQPSVSYRARATAVPQGTVITAVALTSTDATLSNLVRIELAVSAAVLAILCIIALWTVRRGLRPLEDMSSTAGAIASGDLSRRIDSANPATEVGRLGSALNAMLTQIESGFAEKSATEARLRQFVADASHELRTPLTSIRGYAELLRKGAFVEVADRDRALRRVEHEAARMGGLVDDLLLLARLDQGRPLRRDPVDLARICRDAVFDARMAAPDREFSVEAPVPVTVAGDRDRLAQVAHNLIRNAVVHTPPATPVEVSVAAVGNTGVLRVVDHGPGITPARLERVFDRFYRTDTARKGQGTGLGLSIVRAIAEALGGCARAERNPAGGTTFVVEVPLEEQPTPTAQPAVAEGTRLRGLQSRRHEGRPAEVPAPAAAVLTRVGTGPAGAPRAPGPV